MPSFIANTAPVGWHPEPGDLVIGRSGKHIYQGRVQESKSEKRKGRHGKPAIFQRAGFVGVYIDIEAILSQDKWIESSKSSTAVNEVRPATLGTTMQDTDPLPDGFGKMLLKRAY